MRKAERLPSRGLRRFWIVRLILAAGLMSIWPSQTVAVEPPRVNELTLEVFVRSDSKHSQDAKEFAEKLQQQRRGLRVVVHDVLDDATARGRFWKLCKKFQVAKPGLPAFFTCNRARFGFSDAKTSGRAVEDLFTIRAFVREGCPHCGAAKQFLRGLQERWPAIGIVYSDIVSDPTADGRMMEMARQYGVQVTGLPVIEVYNRIVVGYDTDATTGRRIEDILRKASLPLDEVPAKPEPRKGQSDRQTRLESNPEKLLGVPAVAALAMLANTGAGGDSAQDIPPLPPEAEEDVTVAAPQTSEPPIGIELPGWGMVRVSDIGMPTFTFVIGLVDGFNPCAMWVLVFLLSLLVNVRNRTKILAIAGTFVVVSGLAYFAFMAAWLNVFLLVGYARPLQIALGLAAVFIGAINVKDFFAFKKGITLSIPESARQGIYARVRKIITTEYLSMAVALAVVLAIGVNVIELLCTAGLPAMYTQILTMQELPTWQNYAYLFLYNVAYMFDDSVMLGVFVVTLSHHRVQEREGRYLKLLSGLVILALGAVMLFKPQWLQLSEVATRGVTIGRAA